MAPPPPLHKPPRPQGLNFGAYNICDGRYFGLAQAIWVLQIRNYDVMMLKETKISDKAYCHNCLG